MNEELERLIRLFEGAAALVEQELLRALARGAKSTARQKRERLAVIRAILAGLRKEAVGTTGEPGQAWEAIRAAYLQGLRDADTGLRRAGREPVGVELSGVHLRAAEELYAALSEHLDGAIAHVGRKANDAFRKVTLSEILTSQLAGRGQAKTAEAIAEDLRRRGIEGFTDSRGRGWSLERYASMATHTTAREAATVATLNRLAEAGIDLVRWAARPTVGAREPCERCRRLDGNVYSIAGETEGYPVLEEAPPLHPWCGCILVASVEALSGGGSS